MGVSWSGGPLYADAFGAKRGPSPYQLVESFKQIHFACAEFNALGTAILPLRLYCASALGQQKPRSASMPRSLERIEIQRLLKLNYVRRTFNSADVEDVHEITNYPLLDTIDRCAVDPKTGLSYFDKPSLVATLCRYLDIVGLAYLKPESENGAGLKDLLAASMPPPLMWPLQSQYVRPIRQPDSALIEKFGYFADVYDPGDLVWIRLRPSLRDPYGAGYAAAQAAWQYGGLEDKGISMWDQLLGTGARPNLLVSAKDPNMAPGDDERKRYEYELNMFHARGRAGRAHVTNGAWEYTPLNYQGFDTGEMQVNNYNLERMCNCYGVPVSFMTRETNLANFQAGRTFHAQFGIEPRAQCIASSLTELTRKYDKRLFWAFDSAIGEDKAEAMRLMIEQVKAGLVTGNEANADQPWAPKPYLEEPWIPNNLVQPSMAAEKHETGMAAAAAGAQALAAGGKGQGPQQSQKNQPSDEERAVLHRASRLLGRLERELRR
jgi:Phage portal protein